MNKDVKLMEFYYYILKTCFAYEVHIGPGMTYMDLWQSLVVKLDFTARERLKAQIMKEMEGRRIATLEQMLSILTGHTALTKTSRKQIS